MGPCEALLTTGPTPIVPPADPEYHWVVLPVIHSLSHLQVKRVCTRRCSTCDKTTVEKTRALSSGRTVEIGQHMAVQCKDSAPKQEGVGNAAGETGPD